MRSRSSNELKDLFLSHMREELDKAAMQHARRWANDVRNLAYYRAGEGKWISGSNGDIRSSSLR